MLYAGERGGGILLVSCSALLGRSERTKPIELWFGPNFQKTLVRRKVKLFFHSLQDVAAGLDGGLVRETFSGSVILKF